MVFGHFLGDLQVVAYVFVPGIEPQRPVVVEDRPTDFLLLEIGICQVIVEFARLPAARQNRFVKRNCRRKVVVDVSRVGLIPQLVGIGCVSCRGGLLRLRVLSQRIGSGGSLPRNCRAQQRSEEKENISFHGF